MFGPTKLIEDYRQYYGTDEDFGWRFRMKISAEDFYGGRTGPLEKFYLFIYFLLMISDEDFYGGRTGPLEKIYLFIYLFIY